MAKAASKQLTRKDLIRIVAVGVVFAAIYVTLILPLLQSAIPFDLALRRFEFRQNEWFEARDVRIIDNFNPRLAVTNDEMFYEIEYRNLKLYELSIDAELQIIFGGIVVDSFDTSNVILSASGTGQHNIRFFTNHTGENQLILNTRILNTTGSSLLGSVSSTINIPVYSVEAAAQERQNEITLYGVIVSVPIGFATIIGLVISLNLNRRQAEGLRQQITIARDSFNHQLVSRWEQDYEGHSKQLSQTIFDGWLRKKDFFANCGYDSEIFFRRNPSKPAIPFIDQAAQHMQQGYPEAWVAFLEAQSESASICDEVQQLVQSFQSYVRSQVRTQCPELIVVDRWSPHINNSFFESRYFFLLFQSARGRPKGERYQVEVTEDTVELNDDKGNRPTKRILKMTLNNTELAVGEDSLMKRLRSITYALLANDELLEYARKYESLIARLRDNEKNQRHDKSIRAIWESIHGGSPLEKPGACNLCPKKPDIIQ